MDASFESASADLGDQAANSFAVRLRIIEAGWLVLAAGLPLFIAPWGRNPFELPKVLLLWVIVAIMGAARCTMQDTGCRSRASCIVYRVSCILAIVFAGVLLLTTVASVNPLLSAQGSYDRMQGGVTILCYLALFLLVADRLRTSAQVHRLLAASVYNYNLGLLALVTFVLEGAVFGAGFWLLHRWIVRAG